MISTQQQTDWCQAHLGRMTAELPGGELGWLSDQRRRAVSSLERMPQPNRKQEAWRYTDVQQLMETAFVSSSSAEKNPAAALDSIEWSLPQLDSYKLIFVNGRFRPRFSNIEGLPKGIILKNLGEALMDDHELLSNWLGKLATDAGNVFTQLNSAQVSDGLYMRVESGITLDKPIEVIHLGVSSNTPVMMQPRHLVVMEEGAKATLIERFAGANQSHYFHNILSEIVLERGAELSHYRIQNESRKAYHLSTLYLSQEADSLYRGCTLAFGAAWSRTDYNSVFRQVGANCELSGLYTAGDSQLTDIHLDVRHEVPGCSSREHFKGIIYGKGRAVFDGRILVGKQAQQSDAHLTNNNLMLSRDGEIDTKPQLEIYADDVKCSHGTTIGQIEPEQLFYLRSRGIDGDAARRMLSTGFAGEVIDAITVESVRDYAYELLNAALNRAEKATVRTGG